MNLPPTIEEEWDTYAKAIFYGVNPSRTQYEETRQAFYAGCTVMFKSHVQIASDDVRMEDAAEWLDNASQEIYAFGDSVIRQIDSDKAREN